MFTAIFNSLAALEQLVHATTRVFRKICEEFNAFCKM
jgi:hypothetical protein